MFHTANQPWIKLNFFFLTLIFFENCINASIFFDRKAIFLCSCFVYLLRHVCKIIKNSLEEHTNAPINKPKLQIVLWIMWKLFKRKIFQFFFSLLVYLLNFHTKYKSVNYNKWRELEMATIIHQSNGWLPMCD